MALLLSVCSDLVPEAMQKKIYLKASLPNDVCFLLVKYFNKLRVKQKIISIMGFTFKIEYLTDILLIFLQNYY